jgi:transcription antitermination factor NusG
MAQALHTRDTELTLDAVAHPWFAIHTQAGRETVAAAHLRLKCERVFFPRYRQRVILHGYRREVVRPLFPGYLFAAFDPARELKGVHYARGVRGVVAFGSCPAEVPVELLHGIEAGMHDGFVVLQPVPLRVGERVEITAGPLKGYTGIFAAERSGAERVAILLDTLKFNASAIVDRAAVRPVN